MSFFGDIFSSIFGGRAAAPSEMTSAKGSGYGVTQYSEPPARDIRGLLMLHNTSPGFRRVAGLVSERVGSAQSTMVARGRELKDQHPLRELWDQPNPYMTGADWRALDCLYLDTAGEVFLALIESPITKKIELYPLPPSWVTPVWTGDLGSRITFRVKLGDSGVEQMWSDSEIVWIKRIDPTNPYGRGAGLGRACLDEAETAEYSARHTKAYFYNNATPPVLIGMPKADKAQVKDLEERWHSKLQGFMKAWRTHFVNFDVVVHQLSAPLKDQNTVAVMQAANDEIRMTFGVPPELIGQLSSSNRATILEAETIFATNCLEPRLRKLYDGYRNLLLKRLPAPMAANVTLGWVSTIPGDAARIDAVMNARPWAFTVNEHRASIGMSPRPDGDVYVTPANTVRVDAQPLPIERSAEGEQKSAKLELIDKLPDNVIMLHLTSHKEGAA